VFCPLCKAEYRAGFRECSDCRIALVESYAEAESIGADRLWDGDDRKKCERILDALLAAGIPYHSKESLKKNPWSWISIFLWQFLRRDPRFTSRFGFFARIFRRRKPLLSRWKLTKKPNGKTTNDMHVA
jgi:hypothetical protein